MPVPPKPHLHQDNSEGNLEFKFDKLSSTPQVFDRPSESTTVARWERGARKRQATSDHHTSPETHATGMHSSWWFKEKYHHDNGLLFHFLTHSAYTIALDGSTLRKWQMITKSIAQTHGFVMHALLGFSALHLVHLAPRESPKLLEFTFHHYEEATKTFKDQVDVIKSDNCDAVFVFSVVLVLTELGLMHPIAQGKFNDIDPIDRLTQLLMVAKNALSLWQNASTFHPGSLLPALVGHDKKPAHRYETIAQVRSMLSHLESLNHERTTDPGERRVYSETIYELGASYYAAMTDWTGWFAPLRWAKAFSPDFVTHLRLRRPLTILILGHYCILVRNTDVKHWWLRGWSDQVYQSVLRSIDQEWVPYLTETMRALKKSSTENSVSGVRI